jgi:large subunit ribosomal protein L6
VIPAGVSARVDGDSVTVRGPKGSLVQSIVNGTSVAVDGSQILVARSSDEGPVRAAHGLMRALLRNMVVGVSEGFQRNLDIQGVGFRAEMRGTSHLVLNIGFSHPVEYAVPSGVTVTVTKTTRITVAGHDKQQVGQVAAIIRGFRPPDSYKGKGIRYETETPRIKEGKSA